MCERTDSQVAVVLVKCDKIHCHIAGIRQLAVERYNLCKSMDDRNLRLCW